MLEKHTGKVQGKRVLQWIINKQDVRVQTGCTWLPVGPSGAQWRGLTNVLSSSWTIELQSACQKSKLAPRGSFRWRSSSNLAQRNSRIVLRDAPYRASQIRFPVGIFMVG